MIRFLIFSFLLMLTSAGHVFSQESALYPHGRSSKVLFPLGDISFVDEVVSFKYGNPHSEESYLTKELGWYNMDEGEIYGVLTSVFIFEGKWVEASPSTACGSTFMGSQHWGKIIIKFNNNYSEFNAKWNYYKGEATQ